MYGDMIRKCTLFSGLNEPDLQYALHFFESSRGFYSKGDTMNRVGDPLPSFGLLLAGSAQVNMDDMDGGHMIMATVAPGDTFGESLNFLGMDAPVYITAMTDVAVLWMKTTRMKDGSAPKDSRDIQLSNRFTAGGTNPCDEQPNPNFIENHPSCKAGHIVFSVYATNQ